MPTPFEDPTLWAVFCALGIGTSALSAVVGLAGGVLLLAALLLYLDPVVAIPVHGVAQLASNGSRAWLQRAHVEWAALRPFLLLLLPGGVVGVLLLESIPADVGRFAIGAFALAAIWLPAWFRLQPHREPTSVRRRFLAAGAVAGVANMIFGATGPLMAPFVLSLGLERLATVATLAIVQGAGHTMKIGVFAARGFAFADYAAGLAMLCAAAVLGSWLGTQLLRRLPAHWFQWMIRGAVTIVALRLVWQGASRLYAG